MSDMPRDLEGGADAIRRAPVPNETMAWDEEPPEPDEEEDGDLLGGWVD